MFCLDICKKVKAKDQPIRQINTHGKNKLYKQPRQVLYLAVLVKLMLVCEIARGITSEAIFFPDLGWVAFQVQRKMGLPVLGNLFNLF